MTNSNFVADPRKAKFQTNHTQWLQGDASYLEDDKVIVPESTFLFVDYSNRLEPKSNIVEYEEIAIALPSLSATASSYLYATASGCDWDDNEITPDKLYDQVYLGCYSDGSFSPFLVERSENCLYLLRKGGILNINVSVQGKAGTKNVECLGGFISMVGANHWNSWKNPNEIEVQPQNITWDVFTPNRVLVASNVTELDFSQRWGNDELLPVTGNDAMALYLYYCPFRQNKWAIILGDVKYGNLNQAKQRFLATESHQKPDFLGYTVAIATVLGRNNFSNASNSNHVAFITSNSNSVVSISAASSGIIYKEEIKRIKEADVELLDPAIFKIVLTTDTEKVIKSYDGTSWEFP